jgi:hypothetical protein
MSSRALLTTALVALSLLLPGSAGAAAQLPVGEAHGVRATQRGDRVTFVFTGRATGLWRRIAGRPVELRCMKLVTVGASVLEGTTSHGTRAPKRRRPLSLRNAAGSDWCTISRQDRVGPTVVVAVPLTQAGANALDERARAGALNSVLNLAGAFASATRPVAFPAPEQLTRGRLARLLRRERVQVAVLGAASDTPPVGAVGYWSDGAQRMAVVTVTATGRRLYVELGPDDELHTNIARMIFGD